MLLSTAAFAVLAMDTSIRPPNLQSVHRSVHPAPSPAGVGTRRRPAVEIDWRTLAGLDHRTGRRSDLLQRLDGRTIRIPGFIVPLDDYAEEVTEFLLVPYFGACVHVPPPPPNQMVYVRLAGGRRTRMAWWAPVWLEGRLRITTHQSPYGVAGFVLAGERVTPYEEPGR